MAGSDDITLEGMEDLQRRLNRNVRFRDSLERIATLQKDESVLDLFIDVLLEKEASDWNYSSSNNNGSIPKFIGRLHYFSTDQVLSTTLGDYVVKLEKSATYHSKKGPADPFGNPSNENYSLDITENGVTVIGFGHFEKHQPKIKDLYDEVNAKFMVFRHQSVDRLEKYVETLRRRHIHEV